jgi:hypothetical protein
MVRVRGLGILYSCGVRFRQLFRLVFKLFGASETSFLGEPS